MPPQYVKPYVKRGKTDAADAEAIAEAIAEAVTRPTMRFVPVKTTDQQSALMLHKTRDLLVRQRTALINALRGHMGELGIVAPQGARKVPGLAEALRSAGKEVPEVARRALDMLVDQLGFVEIGIRKAEAGILAWHRASEASRRLATIPGIGPITASAIAATVPDAGQFSSGRQFAAWLGLTPKPRSSGGKERLGRISREGIVLHGSTVWTHRALPAFRVMRCGRTPGARARACGSARRRRWPPRSPAARRSASAARRR